MIGPNSSGLRRGNHHYGPACLAVADNGRLAFGFGMQGDHPLEKHRLGSCDVFNRLARHGFGQEADEVARVAGLERDADFTVGLEPANSRTMSGAWIEHDKRPLDRIDLDTRTGMHPYERVVHRARQLPSVHDEIARELQHVRRSLGSVLLVLFGPLPHDVQKQDGALAGIDPVVPCVQCRARRHSHHVIRDLLLFGRDIGTGGAHGFFHHFTTRELCNKTSASGALHEPGTHSLISFPASSRPLGQH